MGSQGKTIPCCRLRNYVTKQSKEKVVRKYLAHSRPIEFTIRFQHCTNTAPTFHERCCANIGSFCSNRRRDYVKQKKKKSTQKSLDTILHQGFQTPRNAKSTPPCFSVCGTLNETLALVFDVTSNWQKSLTKNAFGKFYPFLDISNGVEAEINNTNVETVNTSLSMLQISLDTNHFKHPGPPTR